MAFSSTIVGLGESLFDVFPDRQVLGGAPLNAAVHAHQLAAGRGGGAVMVSRVGQDELGQRVIAELNERGVGTEDLQTDPDHKTGIVHVRVDEHGQPDYEISPDVAWDWLQWDPDLEALAHRCDAVTFSSLAQRHSQSRSSIQRFLSEASGAVRLFDLTIRQSYYDRDLLRRSCALSSVVKANLEELELLRRLLGLDGTDVDDVARSLRERFGLDLVVVTRGAEGTVLYTPRDRFEGSRVQYPPAPDADSVGAGDAATAAIAVGMVFGLAWPRIVDLANHAGAYVASVPGGTPTLAQEILDMAKS